MRSYRSWVGLGLVLLLASCGGSDEASAPASSANAEPRIDLFPPSFVEASVAKNGRVTVRWQDANATEDGYLLERRPPNSQGWVRIGSYPPDTSEAADEETTERATYFYRVVAWRGEVTRPSEEIRVVIPDQTPPDTEIIFKPPRRTARRSTTLYFKSNEDAVSFVCTLNDRHYPCSTGLDCFVDGDYCVGKMSLSGLAGGTYTVAVYAVDAAGNVDATPATWTWEVDVTAPKITWVTTPPSATDRSTYTFDWTSDDPEATYRCSLNGAPPTTCTPPVSGDMGLVAPSNPVFVVYAVDPVGNESSLEYRWQVDLWPPQITFQEVDGQTDIGDVYLPAGLDPLTVKFAVADDSALAVTDPLICAGSWGFGPAPCPNLAGAGPYTTSFSGVALTEGTHRITITATDVWGHAASSSLDFRVDGTPPVVSFSEQPGAATDVSYLRYRFTGSDAPFGAGMDRFECRWALGAAPTGSWNTCVAPYDLEGIASGSTVFFELRGIDRAGWASAVITATTVVSYPSYQSTIGAAGGDVVLVRATRLGGLDGDAPPVADVDVTQRSVHFQDLRENVVSPYLAEVWLDYCVTLPPSGVLYLFGPRKRANYANPNTLSGAPGARVCGTNVRFADFWLGNNQTMDEKWTYRVGWKRSESIEIDEADIAVVDTFGVGGSGWDHLIARGLHPMRGWLIDAGTRWRFRSWIDVRTQEQAAPNRLLLEVRAPEGDVLGAASLAWSALGLAGGHATTLVDVVAEAPYCAGYVRVELAADPPFATSGSRADDWTDGYVVPVAGATPPIDDRYEPNDVAGAESGPWSTPVALPNLVLADVDRYAVTASVDGFLTAAVQVPGGYGQPVSVTVYEGSMLLASASGTDTAAASFNAVAGNVYVVEVASAAYPAGCRRYRLSVAP